MIQGDSTRPSNLPRSTFIQTRKIHHYTRPYLRTRPRASSIRFWKKVNGSSWNLEDRTSHDLHFEGCVLAGIWLTIHCGLSLLLSLQSTYTHYNPDSFMPHNVVAHFHMFSLFIGMKLLRNPEFCRNP